MKKGIINIYDYIGSGGITVKDISEIISNFEAEGINEFEVHISSMGGSVFEGIAIYNLLRSKNVTVIIDGIAASIASVIALAGKEVKIYDTAYMLIHNPWTLAIGNSNDLKKTKEQLDQLRDTLIMIYKNKTGKDEDELKNDMDYEKLMNADECLEQGFVDVKIEQVEVKNYVALYSEIVDDNQNNNLNEGDKMNEAFLALIGFTAEEIKAGVSEEQITAKVNKVKESFNLREGEALMALTEQLNNSVPKADYEKLQNDFNEFKAEVDSQKADIRKNEIKVLINDAKAKFKIDGREEKAWATYLAADFETAKAELEAIAENSVKPGKLPQGNEEIDKTDSKAVHAAIQNYIKEQADKGVSVTATEAAVALGLRD